MKFIDEESERSVGYTCRISVTDMNKLHYIAYHDNRPLSYELRALVVGFIDEFEKRHGKISISAALSKKLERRREKHRKANLL